jgi:hypothetical protein
MILLCLGVEFWGFGLVGTYRVALGSLLFLFGGTIFFDSSLLVLRRR